MLSFHLILIRWVGMAGGAFESELTQDQIGNVAETFFTQLSTLAQKEYGISITPIVPVGEMREALPREKIVFDESQEAKCRTAFIAFQSKAIALHEANSLKKAPICFDFLESAPIKRMYEILGLSEFIKPQKLESFASILAGAANFFKQAFGNPGNIQNREDIISLLEMLKIILNSCGLKYFDNAIGDTRTRLNNFIEAYHAGLGAPRM